jgi:hypothetical protein
VTFSKKSMAEKEKEITDVALSMRSQCDFIFKLDTDEFLGVYHETGDTLRVDGNAFHAELRRLPMDGRKYLIMYRKELLKQCVCGDNALAIEYNPIKIILPHDYSMTGESWPKLFYPSRSLVTIDTGSHFGQTTVDGILMTKMAILHLHNKCYDVYMKNLREILLSRREISASQTDQQNFEALDRKKDLFEDSCGMPSCHKAKEYHSYLRDSEGHRRDFLASAAVGGDPKHYFTALRDRVLKLQVKYGDM